MTTTTFLVPDFDNSIPNKINQDVEVKSKNKLSTSSDGWHSAIATNGFSSKKDGAYVYVTRVDDIGDGYLMVGFTDTATYDSTQGGTPGDEFSGTSLYCYWGTRYPDEEVEYLPSDITCQASEVISILIISNNGAKKEVQWIVDGEEGPVVDCTNEKNGLGNGKEIFPSVSFAYAGQQVTMIPFDQVKSR